jgi:hypothetical protein
LLAWLTVLPDIGPLPESSQTRDMVVFLVSLGQKAAPQKQAAPKFDFRRLRGLSGRVKASGAAIAQDSLRRRRQAGRFSGMMRGA